jgi:type II secretory ATPase GspE/PulE/Tfp pilus assembly ATPase PilB-like protein
VIAKIKIMTNSMNITERRIPQSGRIQVMAKGNPSNSAWKLFRRCMANRSSCGFWIEKLCRWTFKNWGFFPDTLDRYLGLMAGVGGKKNFGIVLVCGPTGSGKSTTLYASLQPHQPRRH